MCLLNETAKTFAFQFGADPTLEWVKAKVRVRELDHEKLPAKIRFKLMYKLQPK